ncbi:MAG: DUF4350 domain-containing protein [Myxococcaceae bacterium]|nr:DUF4350 domain-containing protein [Myxococcaceae bacterium]
MSRLEVSFYAGLLALALGAGLLVRSAPADSGLPSVHNRGPLGLYVLRRFLEERGATVVAHEGPLTALPGGTRTVVLASPTGTPVTREEVKALEAFATAGGTVVALMPATREAQPALSRWLEVGLGPALPSAAEGGASVAVSVRGGPFGCLEHLRVGGGPSLTVGRDDAVSVTIPADVWWVPVGAGELVVAPGADLATNHFLELDDNATFWANLAARGPIAFDEGHHLLAAGPPPSRNLVASVLQLAVVALALLLSAGRRLGPARVTTPQVHRSSLEYVASLGALTRRAKVEGELAHALRERLREQLAEGLGVAPSLPFPELARLAAERSGLPAARYEALDAALAAAGPHTSAAEYAALAKEEASLERALSREKAAAPVGN